MLRDLQHFQSYYDSVECMNDNRSSRVFGVQKWYGYPEKLLLQSFGKNLKKWRFELVLQELDRFQEFDRIFENGKIKTPK